MSRIRSANTKFEKVIFAEIKRGGIKFKTNYSGAIGKPDIALPRKRRAVFLHSDFWHGWQLPRWEKILPSDFWREKLRKNRRRDRLVISTLRREGWNVLVLWEHTYKQNPKKAVEKVTNFLKNQ